MRRGVVRNVAESACAADRGADRLFAEINYERARIAQFFADLRRALRLTLPQSAAYFGVPANVIEDLENGRVELLPPHSGTARFILDYAALADIDGRPVLAAIGNLVSVLSHYGPHEEAPALQPAPSSRSLSMGGERLRRAGSAIANGAMRLPKDAMDQVRRRPERAFYALSLPLGLLLLTLNSAAITQVSQPFSLSVEWFSGFFQEHFGRVQNGLRYIEVDDPRSRRADKLPIKGGS